MFKRTQNLSRMIAGVICRQKSCRIVSINPDLRIRLGHYLHFDLRLKEQAQKEEKDFLILGNRGLDSRLIEEHAIVPAFTHNSWKWKTVAGYGYVFFGSTFNDGKTSFL